MSRKQRLGGSLNEVFDSPTQRRVASQCKNFFGVIIPSDVQTFEGEEAPYVFEDLVSTIRFCKRYKDLARFEKFTSREQAEQFSLDSQSRQAIYESIMKSQERDQKKIQIADKMPFRCPKPQDYVQFRKLIMEKKTSEIHRLVWSNPRYLVGSGDNPTILQEGCRYNAFHVAARSDAYIVLYKLISYLRNESLFILLYPEDERETRVQRQEHLINMYLNIPDRTKRGDTPLHFAASMGFPRCVAILLAQEECNRNLWNGDNFTASQIICTRQATFDQEIFNEIVSLFSASQVLLPIVRDEMCVESAFVGEPFRPTGDFLLKHPPLPESQESNLKTVAFIGPIEYRTARRLVELLKTEKPLKHSNIRRGDGEKGLENVVRDVARCRNLPWNEYWPFMDAWADLATENGLRMFENFFLFQLRGSNWLDDGLKTNGNHQTNGDCHLEEAKKRKPTKTSLAIDLFKDFLDSPSEPELPEELHNAIFDSDHSEVASTVAGYVCKYMSPNERDMVISSLTLQLHLYKSQPHGCVLEKILHSVLANEEKNKRFKAKHRKNGEKEKQSFDKNLESLTDSFASLKIQRFQDDIGSKIENGERGDPGSLNGEDPMKRDRTECTCYDKVVVKIEQSNLREELTHLELARIGYINGSLPSKTDYQVWLAMGPTIETLNEETFPAVCSWSRNMMNFNERDMKNWATPKKSSTSTPIPLSRQVLQNSLKSEKNIPNYDIGEVDGEPQRLFADDLDWP